MNRRQQRRWLLSLTSLMAFQAQAQPAAASDPPPEAVSVPAEAAPAPAAEAAPAPAPPPYSPPWYLRPAVPLNALLTDTAVGVYRNANGGGSNGVAFLLGSYKFLPNFALVARLGLVGNSGPPATAGAAAPPTGFTLVNPVLGAFWGLKVHPDLKLMIAFLGAIPIGMGGGNDPNPSDPAAPEQKAFALARATTASGISTRSAMDNAMFAVNDAVIFPGLDLAFVKWGLTVQLEATVLFLIRSRGELVQADTFKLNFTSGLHVGYFITRWLSVGGELHYQRWLVPPRAIATATTAAAWAGMSQASATLGPRFHFKLGTTWLRPGISYSRGFDAPMATGDYHVLQLHLPIVF